MNGPIYDDEWLYDNEYDHDAGLDDGLTICRVCGDVEVDRRVGVCLGCRRQRDIDNDEGELLW